MQAELPAGILPITAPSTHPQVFNNVVIPLSVILPRDGSSFVAVVEPKAKDEHALVLQWRAVQIERQTPFDVKIKSGLHDGERVVDQPLLLLSQLKPEDKSSLRVVVQNID